MAKIPRLLPESSEGDGKAKKMAKKVKAALTKAPAADKAAKGKKRPAPSLSDSNKSDDSSDTKDSDDSQSDSTADSGVPQPVAKKAKESPKRDESLYGRHGGTAAWRQQVGGVVSFLQ